MRVRFGEVGNRICSIWQADVTEIKGEVRSLAERR